MLNPGLNEHAWIKPLNKTLDKDRIKRARLNQILGRVFNKDKMSTVESNLVKSFNKDRIKWAWSNQILENLLAEGMLSMIMHDMH